MALLTSHGTTCVTPSALRPYTTPEAARPASRCVATFGNQRDWRIFLRFMSASEGLRVERFALDAPLTAAGAGELHVAGRAVDVPVSVVERQATRKVQIARGALRDADLDLGRPEVNMRRGRGVAK